MSWSEPRSWFERRQTEQEDRYPELKLASPDMVSRVDALRIDRGELPSAMTRDTTSLAAQLTQVQSGQGGGGFLSGLSSLYQPAPDDPNAPDAAPNVNPWSPPTTGMLQSGNIDLSNRPHVKNPDGSISTVRSISVDADGKTYLIPTVIGDKVVSPLEAIQHWQQTGESLGTFGDSDSANAYAQSLHEEQAAQLGSDGGFGSSLDEMQAGRRDTEAIHNGSLRPQPPELTDPMTKRQLDTGLGGSLSVLDVGGATRGGVLALLRGENPTQTSQVRDLTQYEGIDTPGVRDLPDSGPQIGPVHLTPKTIAGFAVGLGADPTTYLGTPVVDDLVRGAGSIVKAGAKKILGRGAEEAAQAVETGARRATGDTLNAQVVPSALLPGPVRANQTTAEAGTRVGGLLRPRGAEQLGPNYTVRDALGVATDLRRQASSVAQNLHAQGSQALRALGPTVEDGSGNLRLSNVIRQSDGVPALLQDVLENPTRYNLTAEQADGVHKFADVFARIKAERQTFGVGPNEVGLEDGQNFISRLAKEDTKGTELKKGGGGTGSKLGVASEKSRQFADPEEAARAGVVYAHPLEALDKYAASSLKRAGDEHVKNLLTPFGETSADRINKGFQARVEILKNKIAGRRDTLIKQNARAGVRTAETNRARGVAEAAGNRADNQRSYVAQAAADYSPEAAQAARSDVEDTVRQGRQLASEIRQNADRLTAAKRPLTQAERQLVNESRTLETTLDQADRMTGSEFGQTGRYGGSTADLPAANRAELESAKRQYARTLQAADRISSRIDRISDRASTFSERVDELASRGEVLQDMDAAQREAYVTARRGERAVAQQERSLYGAQRELRSLDAEERRATRGAMSAQARQTGATARNTATGDTYDALRDEWNSIKGDWENHKRLAQATPPGRQTVGMDVAPALSGRDFSAETHGVAGRIVNNSDAGRIRRFYSKGVLPDNTVGDVARGAAAISKRIVPLRAVGDISATFNQLAQVAYSHPRTFARNFVRAAGDMVHPENYDAYLAQHADDGAAHGLAVLGKVGEPTELEFGSWMERAPVFKQLQQQFRSITTRNRVDLYNQFVDTATKTGKPLDDLGKEQLARALNRVSGISNSRASDVETLAQFAPNFFRAHLETLSKAATDGTIEGQLARQYLKNMVALGTTISVAAAVAQHRDPREVLNPIEVTSDGGIRMNPNFGTVRVGNHDVSLYGSYDSLARLGVVGVDAVYRSIRDRDAMQLGDAIGYAASTKGGPLVSFASNAIQGQTFGGNSPTSLAGLTEQLTPFSVSQFIADKQRGASTADAIAGVGLTSAGLKANPLSASERVQRGEFDQLGPDQQLQGYRAQSWQDVVKGVGEEATGGAKSYFDWRAGQVRHLEGEFKKAGLSDAQAVKLAEDTTDKQPVAKVYSEIKNAREDQWGLQHPKEAAALLDQESALPATERRFNPTKAVRAYIEASR